MTKVQISVGIWGLILLLGNPILFAVLFKKYIPLQKNEKDRSILGIIFLIWALLVYSNSITAIGYFINQNPFATKAFPITLLLSVLLSVILVCYIKIKK